MKRNLLYFAFHMNASPQTMKCYLVKSHLPQFLQKLLLEAVACSIWQPKISPGELKSISLSQGGYKLGLKRDLYEMRDLYFMDQLRVFATGKEVIFDASHKRKPHSKVLTL